MRNLGSNHIPLKGSGSGIFTQHVARELTIKDHEPLVITPGHEIMSAPLRYANDQISSGQVKDHNRERVHILISPQSIA